MFAAEILSLVVNERQIWQRILNSQDDRVVLQAMMFLMSMRDGKPSQQINVTSTQIHIDASQLERARELAREIRGELSPTLDQSALQLTESNEVTGVAGESPLGADAQSPTSQSSIMLQGTEGGQKGG